MDKRVLGILIVLFLLMAFWFFNQTPENLANDLNSRWKMNSDGIKQRIKDIRDRVKKILGFKDKTTFNRSACEDLVKEINGATQQLNECLEIYMEMYHNAGFNNLYNTWYSELKELRFQCVEKLNELQPDEDISLMQPVERKRVEPLPSQIITHNYYDNRGQGADNSRNDFSVMNANQSHVRGNEENTILNDSSTKDWSQSRADQHSWSQANRGGATSWQAIGARNTQSWVEGNKEDNRRWQSI